MKQSQMWPWPSAVSSRNQKSRDEMCYAKQKSHVSIHRNKPVNSSFTTLSTERRPKHHHALQVRVVHLHDPFHRSKAVQWYGSGGHPKAIGLSNREKPKEEEDAILDLEYPLCGYVSEDRIAIERCRKPRLTSKDFCATVSQPTDPCNRDSILLEKAKDSLYHCTASTSVCAQLQIGCSRTLRVLPGLICA